MTPSLTQFFLEFQNEADGKHFGGKELGTCFHAKTKWICLKRSFVERRLLSVTQDVILRVAKFKVSFLGQINACHH